MNKATDTGSSLAKTFDDHELVTCVHLNCKSEKNKAVYHGIYVSQLYGTLFAIYGRFDIDEEKNDCCNVKKIKLKILNYKGLFNVGFNQTSISVEIDPEEMKIVIPVRALSGIDEMEISIKSSIEVERGKHKRIVFSRLLYPIEGFGVDPENQDKIDILKNVKGGSTNRTDIPDKLIFDTEFNYRDGVDYYDQLLLPGKVGYKPGKPVFSERCLESNVNIAYF